METKNNSTDLKLDTLPRRSQDIEFGSVQPISADSDNVKQESVATDANNEAEVYLAEHHAEWGQYTEHESKRVLRRIDWRILPLITITMTLAGVDKILISNATLYGMTEDVGLHGDQYNWVASIFYFGYMAATFPANAMLQKIPVGKALGCATIGWGALATLMGASNNFGGLLVLRLIMGCFEAPIFPCITALVGMWYTKKEQPTRTAICFAVFSTLITGTVSYGIGHSNTSVAPWRLLFFVFGPATILWGIILLVFLPDSPLKDGFMKGKQRFIAISRVKGNMTGIENKIFKWYQVREAFLDYKTYALFLFYLCSNVPLGGLSTFAAQIVSGLGYSSLETTLLGMPTGMFQTFAGLLVAIPQIWLKNMRCLTSALCCLIPLACSIIIRRLPNDNMTGKLVSYYFFFFFWGPYATVLSLPMANVSGYTKRLTVNGCVFVAYCIAMIIGPQLFIEAEAPRYQTGYNCILAFEICAVICLAVYAFGCMIENKRRDKREGKNFQMSSAHQLSDLTDREKEGFRYIY
ncbi:Major facilitator superfamily domain general substrate transporter [Penicillium nucicola]|uniref:Major facilitator superfamily domain general substrate transporter n=1 Tax=Penicillium nucicola TaxID=1850975 RepID=UPI0025451616|nr:Major facilitator superfamily domain general substrate transporter [Penicillium nucicola]KAJ5761993.1 Major facilitator superfamily domain general substrate transporter [Penicillium nucicola]